MLIPLGLDHMVVKRVPAVSAVLAIGCALGYLAMLALGEDVYAFAFVPADGLVQIGWLTSMFVHVGLLHLLGNLLFFYLAGPVIEDAWGRGRFLALFLLGDLAGNGAMWLLDSASAMPSVGASAAVAACMGALCVQYPRRQVRVFFWYLLHARIVFMPVTVWGGLWLLLEVYELAAGAPGSGLVFVAHTGGFVFGVAMAAVMRGRGIGIEAPAAFEYAPRPSVMPTPDPTPSRTSAAPAASPARVSARVEATPRPEPPRATTPPQGEPRPVPKAPRLRSDLG